MREIALYVIIRGEGRVDRKRVTEVHEHHARHAHSEARWRQSEQKLVKTLPSQFLGSILE